MKKIIILIILVVIIGGGFWWWQRQLMNNQLLPNVDNKSRNGIIEGSLSYPSEEIPDSIKVCAENISTQKEYCTSQHITSKKYTYNKGYKLEVPVGKYYVFATGGLAGLKDSKAYYSEFVICGLNVDCPSHEPVMVTVEEGKITSNIDPHDW
ncbi:MAG: hypothetical protein GY874_12255 [Desulfobacteraceae bacterium]|nr:hypothetical protein [Desulfobacteraceae bacterium]